MNSQVDLKMLILEDAAFYDAQMTDLKLRAFANALEGIPLGKVAEAMGHYRNEKGRRQMPMPADIKAYLTPQLDDRTQAIEAAARTIAAVTKFGWAQGAAAREYIGELGWSAVERSGGWNYVCVNLGTNLQVGTFQAQLRDICAAQLLRAKAGQFEAPALPPRDQRAELESAKEVMKTITAKAEKKEE